MHSMKALSNADFLEVWERGVRLHPLDRGLLTLGAALPDDSYESIADWPLGRRNQALAELRSSCFGSRLEAQTACPKCGEKLEFQMDPCACLAGPAGSPATVVIRNHSFRLPTSRDLARAAEEPDARSAAIHVLEACRLDGAPLTWSDPEIEEAGERLAFADPYAEIRVSLKCPTCTNDWEDTLDINAFLWAEIASRAKCLLMDIHALAGAYGWSEEKILSLSEQRRAFYLEAVGS